jgi:uncharacterized protein
MNSLSQKDLAIVSSIINKYINPNKNLVFIFGSRAKNNSKTFSDIDIGIVGEKISPEVYFEIVEAFEDSDLPYIVELVKFTDVSDAFIELALEAIIPINFIGDSDEVRRVIKTTSKSS